MNLLDKAIAYFNPKMGLARAKFRAGISLIGTSYESTTDAPHYNTYVWDNTADDDIKELQTARATSRYYYNNSGFYGGVVECAIDHVVGSGLKAKSAIKESQIKNISVDRIKVIETMMNDYFNSWADSTISDTTAKDNFYLNQRLAYLNYKVDGDCFATLPLRKLSNASILQVNIIDAQFISSIDSSFIEGIKTSDSKMPLEYSVKQTDGSYARVKAFKNGKRNMLHVFKRRKAKQLRGLPFLNAISRDLSYIDDLMKYELTASKLAAIFFGSIETQSKEDLLGSSEDNLLGNPGEQKQTAKNTVKENTITQLAPGDKLEIHQQGRSHSDFDNFIQTSLKKVSSNTRIPLEIILAQFVSSYSASRAAMLQMQKFVKPEREIFINSFCKPTRDQVITWGVLNGDLDIPEFFENRTALLRAVWVGEAMGSVDPIKDIKAKVLAVEKNLETNTKATMDLGNGDFETNVKIRKEEQDLLKENGLIEEKEINNVTA